MCTAMRLAEGRWEVTACGAERYPICMTYSSTPPQSPSFSNTCIFSHLRIGSVSSTSTQTQTCRRSRRRLRPIARRATCASAVCAITSRSSRRTVGMRRDRSARAAARGTSSSRSTTRSSRTTCWRCCSSYLTRKRTRAFGLAYTTSKFALCLELYSIDIKCIIFY